MPIYELYRYCEIARKMLTGKYCVGRVIARPFEGEYPFTRTSRRHDFSAEPPSETMLDTLKAQGFDTVCIGKIGDIFAGKGTTSSVRTTSNDNGMERLMEAQKQDFRGLCFVNLVDFDSSFGHRRNAVGYAEAITRFDRQIAPFIDNMRDDDVLMITADHGCDPMYKGTEIGRAHV